MHLYMCPVEGYGNVVKFRCACLREVLQTKPEAYFFRGSRVVFGSMCRTETL